MQNLHTLGVLALLQTVACADDPVIPSPTNTNVLQHLERAGLRTDSLAFVECTAARARPVDQLVAIVTDYSLDSRAILGGASPPQVVTLPGGTYGGTIVAVSDVPRLVVGQHFIVSFGPREHLLAAVPASASGEVELDGRQVSLGELEGVAR